MTILKHRLALPCAFPLRSRRPPVTAPGLGDLPQPATPCPRFLCTAFSLLLPCLLTSLSRLSHLGDSALLVYFIISLHNPQTSLKLSLFTAVSEPVPWALPQSKPSKFYQMKTVSAINKGHQPKSESQSLLRVPFSPRSL